MKFGLSDADEPEVEEDKPTQMPPMHPQSDEEKETVPEEDRPKQKKKIPLRVVAKRRAAKAGEERRRQMLDLQKEVEAEYKKSDDAAKQIRVDILKWNANIEAGYDSEEAES